MRDYRRVLVLVGIMTVVAVVIGGVALLVLYDTAIAEQHRRLAETVKGKARQIEAIAGTARGSRGWDEAVRTDVLARVEQALARSPGPGETGGIVLGERRGDMVALLFPRGAEPESLPLDAPAATPLRLALAGASGTIVTPDRRGVRVLAAYEPVSDLGLAVVAQIDSAEVDAPFVRAGAAVAVLALVTIALGTTLFFRVGTPMIDRIREGERRYRDLFDSMSSGVAVLARVDGEPDFVVRDVNRAAERIDRIERRTVLGRRLTDVLPDVGRCGVLEVSLRVHETGAAERLAGVLYDDGRICGWRDYNLYRLPTGEVVSLFDDVSERRATEDQLRQAQKMEVLGQLTGGVAHDFNNLLAIVIGNLQLFAERGDLDRPARALIEDALWSAQRGAELTNRLLAFARRQPLDPVATDVNALVGGMAGLLRRTLDSRIDIRTDLAQPLWPTLIDRSQLEAALMNLIVNARDAMADGGELILRTRNIAVEHPDARDEAEPGEFVVICVADTGSGMADDVKAHMFEPFFTTKEPGKGSGLGLSMVYGFVKQSGGFVRVESAVGRGTAVSLFLPRAVCSAADAGVEPSRRVAGEAG